MSIANTIPSVWAADILRALDTLLVYASPNIINRDYQGQIASSGDTVRISMISDVSVSDYTRDTDMAAPESLTDAQLSLIIDQQKSFNFEVDDLDTLQANVDLRAEAARRAAYALRKATDSFVAGLYSDIDTGNFLGSEGSPITGFSGTNTKAVDQLVQLGVLLDQTDTPEDSRFAVLPPWLAGYVIKDPRFSSYGTAQNRAVIERGLPSGANGVIGEAAGFTLYKSNQVPNTSSAKYKVIAGHRSAWSMADQLLKVEPYRLEKRFADGLKGLHVYGAKVVRPSNLACLVASDA